MSAATPQSTPQSNTNTGANRNRSNRRGGGGHGRGSSRGRGNNSRGRGRGAPSEKAPALVVDDLKEVAHKEDANDDDDAASNADGEPCWICAEPVKFYSVAVCNHRTCHVCALRLRALYKKLECAFCKVSIAP